jgi:hypothetical protein
MNVAEAIAFLQAAQTTYGNITVCDAAGWEVEQIDVVRIQGNEDPNVKIHSVMMEDFDEDTLLASTHTPKENNR